MSTPFDPTRGLIVVAAKIHGPTSFRAVQLALDTGASLTTINADILALLGYDPAVSTDRLRMTTGSGVEFVPRLPIDRLETLGQQRIGFPIVAHTLPPSASVDGLLGLDFLRGQELLIDFRNGWVTLK
jgi:predicted aspartyl protease